MPYGVQMYSVRDLAGISLVKALETVAAQGYEGVEFAGFFGMAAKDVKAQLDRLGLAPWATHTGLQDLTAEKLADVIAYHQAIGCDTIVIPGSDVSTDDKLDETIKAINRIVTACRAAGLRIAYHNHSHEFIPTAGGRVPYDEIVKRTQIALEIDTYWAWNAGRDPVEMLRTYGDRVLFIHLKDGLSGGEGKPLGMGQAPVEAVWKTAKAMGIPMIVESETQTPDGPTETAICIQYLKGLI